MGAAALALACTIAAAVTVAAPPVAAVDTPIYNAPPGGGPITTVVMKAGPYYLDALGGIHDQDEGLGAVPRPKGSYGIKSAAFDLVDENDQPLGRHDVHLHHFVIGAIGKTDTACPDRQYYGVKSQPLIGSGMERTPIDFADPYAIQVEDTDAWGAVWHLMNMTNTPKTVYVKYTLGIQYGADATNTRFLTPFWADARTCPAGTTWDVPGNGGPNGIETMTKTWTMPFDGYIVGVGGHMHDGGISMTTKHEDGTLICENLASYYLGMLDAISRCPIHDSIAQGEQVSVTSRYDNSAPHAAVMGMSVMFLWQGNQGTPPSTSSTTSTTTPTSTTDPSAPQVLPNVLSAPSSAGASPVVAVPRFTG